MELPDRNDSKYKLEGIKNLFGALKKILKNA
jgi:hypothetical protein